jgi:hypothetical protein
VGPFRDETKLAAEDLSDYQYHFGLLKSATTVEVGAANESVIGIIQNTPEDGEQVVLRTSGQSYLYVDGSTDIAVNDPLDCDASGHGVKQETDKGFCAAVAREAYTSATPGLIVVDIVVDRTGI